VRCLENEDVKFAFGIPGEENLDLMDAIHDSAIRFIPTRHEGAAAFMADFYGRVTGHAGVCLSTLGPGATNLVTGVADAYLDRAPLVAITEPNYWARNVSQETSPRLRLSSRRKTKRPTPWIELESVLPFFFSNGNAK